MKNLKPCRNGEDDALFIEELLSIRTSLLSLGELESISEDFIIEYVIPKLFSDLQRKWRKYRAQPECAAAKKAVESGEVPTTLVAKQRYKLSPKEAIERFWRFCWKVSFELSEDLMKRTQGK